MEYHRGSGACPVKHLYQWPEGGNRMHSRKVCRWHQVRENCWYTLEQGSHPQGPRQVGRMDNRNLCNDECQVLNLGRIATGTNTGWGPVGLGAALLKSKLYISQQYAVVAKVAKSVWGCVNMMQPVTWGKWLSPFTEHSLDHTWNIPHLVLPPRCKKHSAKMEWV